MSPRLLVRASVLALVLLSAGSFAARADDGRPPVPTGAGRPPTGSPIPPTELRASEVRSGPVPTPAPEVDRAPDPLRTPRPRKELVLFVGGYGSDADDGAFDVLKARFPTDRYEVKRLGEDPRFPYDTYGGLDANARVLTDEVRHISGDYSAINIVSHSMGGVVVDRAFSGGLSADDGVRTYVAIAGPHSGSDFARAPSLVLPIIGPVRDIVRAGAALAARDPDSAAARDIATARPIPPPKGVARVDAILATDGLVSPADARDPGVPQRVFLPATPLELADGHGGSLINREIADLVVETVRTHRVPPDRRDLVTKVVAPAVWAEEGVLWRRLLLVVTVVALGLFVLRFTPFFGGAIAKLNALCGRFLRAIGR